MFREGKFYWLLPVKENTVIIVNFESRVGVVVRKLSLHQCGLGLIPNTAPYVGWVCWFSTLLWEVFPSHQELLCEELINFVVSAIKPVS